MLKKVEAIFFFMVPSRRTRGRQWTQTEIKEILFKQMENFGGKKKKEKVAQNSCGVSMLGDTKDPAGDRSE